MPVVGVAKAGWDLDQLDARAPKTAWKNTVGSIQAAFEKLSGLLRYVDGDYQDPATFAEMSNQLKDVQRPTYYLAIPPGPCLKPWWKILQPNAKARTMPAWSSRNLSGTIKPPRWS